MLTPTINLFPGVESKEQADPIPLKVGSDKKSFAIRFEPTGSPISLWQQQAQKLADPNKLPDNWAPVLPQIMRPLEFELTLTDTDKVTSRRTISIQTTEDRGPEVTIAISGLRKVGGAYMCSANAMIPMTNDS